MGLSESVDRYVKHMLQDYKPVRVRGPKAFQDPLYGTNLFYPHEVALIDTPLLQRLRQIFQTGLAYYTYPSAVHNRFVHTLGVVVLATRYLQKLYENLQFETSAGTKVSRGSPPSMDPLKGDLGLVRMSALLHDVGHCFFSHTSEDIYKWDPELIKLVREDGPFAGCKAHEILSYFIVTSESFREFFENYVSREYKCEFNIKDVANLIIGSPPEDPDKAYLSEIINGYFDSDKLEYILRDGRTSGLSLTIDLDRLFYKVISRRFQDNKVRLVSLAT